MSTVETTVRQGKKIWREDAPAERARRLSAGNDASRKDGHFSSQRSETAARRFAIAAVQAAAAWTFPTVLMITAICVFVPFQPAMPCGGLDPSWVFAMNQAVAQGAVFGRDIIFTYGPYASIFTRTYHPATDGLMVWSSLYLGLSFGLAGVLNFRGSRWYLQLLLLLALAGIVPALDLFRYYPLLVGVYVFRSAANASAGRLNSLRRPLLLVALFGPFGLLPLIKGTLVILCLQIVALSVVLLASRREWKNAAVAGLSPLLSLPALWVLSGQPISALPRYFAEMIPIVSGYTEAMFSSGRAVEIFLYTIAAAALLWVVFREVRAATVEKAVLWLMFATVLFMAFKEGFVRHDAHAMASATLIVLAALLVGSLCDFGRILYVPFIACFVWLCIDAHYVRTDTQRFLSSISSTYLSAWNGLTTPAARRARLRHDFQKAIAKIKADVALPVLPGTTDIYSYDQSYLLASDNRWNPRPVIQSYSAYTPALVEKNRAHLTGKNAPDNLIFAVQQIDGRMPSLDDGASWPVILSNYEPAGSTSGFLVLRRRTHNGQLSECALSAGKHSFGDVVNLPPRSARVFAKVNISQSLLGKLANTLFKPSKLKITLNMEDGSQKTYRIVAGMAKTGFLISPLVENTNEFGLLYANGDGLAKKNVKSFVIEAKASWLWNTRYEVELVALDLPANPQLAYEFKR